MSEIKKQTYLKLDERRAQDMYSCGATDAEIAADIGCSRDSVQRWRRRHGFLSNRRREKTGPQLSKLAMEAKQAREHGMTYGQWKAQWYVPVDPRLGRWKR